MDFENSEPACLHYLEKGIAMRTRWMPSKRLLTYMHRNLVFLFCWTWRLMGSSMVLCMAIRPWWSFPNLRRKFRIRIFSLLPQRLIRHRGSLRMRKAARGLYSCWTDWEKEWWKKHFRCLYRWKSKRHKRKNQRHFHFPSSIFEITVSCYLFVSWKNIVGKSEFIFHLICV